MAYLFTIACSEHYLHSQTEGCSYNACLNPGLIKPTCIAFLFHPQKLPLAQECTPKLHHYMLIL